MELVCHMDLWEYLATTPKSIVMYGMGNGADKILAVCAQKGVEVKDFFASDGFVRGHRFHEKTVLSWSEIKQKYGVENLIVLLSFGTSRPEVLENIYRIAEEAELYAPDVPAFGNGVFDRAFFEEHRNEIDDEVYCNVCRELIEMLSDSRDIRFRITLAELYRNIGEFERCLAILDEVNDESALGGAVERIRSEALKKNKLTVVIADTRR